MRCPDCNKFVPYGEAEVEVDDPEFVPEDSKLTIDFSISLPCEECSQELKSGSDTAEVEILPEHFTPGDAVGEDAESLKIPTMTFCPGSEDGKHEWEWEHEENVDVRTEGKGRGTKTFYGADVEVSGACDHCKSTITRNVDCFIQASSLEESV